MEERIGLERRVLQSIEAQIRLNPYCNGRKNRMGWQGFGVALHPGSLNPYCNGRKNRILNLTVSLSHTLTVLILIVMEERIGF